MFKRIIDHLVPPFFADDEEKTRIASLLNVIVLSSLAGAVFYLAFAQFERIPYIILAIAVILSVWQVMKRGYVRVASIAMVMGLLAVFVVVIFTGGGLRAPAYSGLMIVILFAGLILGWRSAVSMAIFSILYGILLLIADSLGMAPQTTTYTNIALWIIESIFFVMAGVFLMLALRTIEDAFRRANKELAERKQAEVELQQSEERYRNLIDQARDIIFTISNDGRITSLNPAFEIFTGWSRAEWLGRAFDGLVAKGDRVLAHDQFDRILHGETLRSLRLRMQARTGDMLVVEMNISPQFKDHQVIGLLGIARDMTRQQQVEDALRESEARYHHILDTMMEGCQIIDFDWRYLYVNETVTAQQAHLKPEEMLNHTVMELYPGVENTELFAVLRRCMEGRAPARVEIQFSFPDGRLGWFELSIQPVREGIFILSTDITARKHARDALRESEERFRSIFQIATVSIWEEDYSEVRAALDELRAQGVTNFRGYLAEHPGFAQRAVQMVKVLDVNEATLKLFGAKDKTELLGSLEKFVKPDNLHEELIAFTEGKTYFEKETSDRRLDGSLINLWMTITFFTDAAGLHKALVCLSDITARKQAEEKIQRQNQRLKALREIDMAILSADSVQNIVGTALTHICELIDCRRAAMALIDEETNEVVVFDVKAAGQTSVSKGTRIPLMLFGDMFQPLSKNQPVLINDLAELPDLPPLFQTLRGEGLRSICVLPLFSQGSQIGTFSLSSEIPDFFDEERIGLGREVANQVAIAVTQSRLVEALQRLNSDLEGRVRERENLIAELTAKNAELEHFIYTVSHDLKSPLVTMKGFLGYLEQDAITGNVERLKGDTQRIAGAVEKMRRLLEDLLELSRIGRFVNPSETIPFEELVHEAIGLVEDRIQEHGVTLDLQPDLPAVYGDRNRLIEVLQNLLDNAIKYMGDQVEPRIEIGQRGEDAERGELLFYVKDNGIGIAPEYRDRVFGLFNKLDARSEGTGIGLALVKRIIEFHGGRIWVESDLEKGSAFCFTLPVT